MWGGGSTEGGNETILTELTVTENGVYGDPTIESGRDPIIWDGVMGDRVAVNTSQFVFVKITDTLISPDGLIGSLITLSNGAAFTITPEYVTQVSGGTIAGELMVNVVNDPLAFDESFAGIMGVSPGFTEVGTYFMYRPSSNVYTTSIAFPKVSISVDGWNKVTVNVPVNEHCTHVPNMVPNDGSYIENVYFNLALFGEDFDAMPDATVAELEKIPDECWISSEELPMGGEASCLFYWLPDTRMGYVVKNGVSNISGGDFTYAIYLQSPTLGTVSIEMLATGEPEQPYVWGYCDINEQCIPIGNDTLTEVPDTTVKVGAANHLLTNLISIRPFTTNG